MMTENIIIPDKYYVGYSRRKHENGTLGFPTPFGTDSASKKRMSTVDGWRDKNISPSTFDNVLLSGYKIAKHIHRDHYWGGGNVVWRIVDPRGFEFEIESSNMSKILQCTDILSGEIQGKCILGRSNKGINVLLPENSEPYVNAIKSTTVFNTSTKTSDLVPGSIVVLKNNTKIVYLGKYYALFEQFDKKDLWNADLSHETYTYSGDKAYHFYLSYNKDNGIVPSIVELASDVKASSVVGVYCQPDQAKELVFNAKTYSSNLTKSVIKILEKKVKPKIELVEDNNELVRLQDFMKPSESTPIAHSLKNSCLISYNKEYYITRVTKYKSNEESKPRHFSNIKSIDTDNATIVILPKMYLRTNVYKNVKTFNCIRAYQSGGRFGGYSYPNFTKVEDFTPDFKVFRIVLKDENGNVILDRLNIGN